MTTPHYHDPLDDEIYEQELATEAVAAERERVRLDAEIAGTEEEREQLDREAFADDDDDDDAGHKWTGVYLRDAYPEEYKNGKVTYGPLRRFARWLKFWRNDGYRYARGNGPWSEPGRWR